MAIHGVYIEPTHGNSYLTAQAVDTPDDDPSHHLLDHSITYRIAVGPQQGCKVFTLQTFPNCESDTPLASTLGEVAGFSLHAGVATKANVVKAFTTDKLLEMFTTRIDPEKSINVNLTMGVKLKDTNEKYALEIRCGIVQFHYKISENTDFTLVTRRDYLNRMLMGDIPISGEMLTAIEGGDPAPVVAIMAAIDSGEIKVEGGSKQDVLTFFSYFDEPVDVGSINLIVR